MKILITSGGCKVPIDDVRHIGNFSSGRYGVQMAKAFSDENEIILFREQGSERIDEHWDEVYNNDNHINEVIYKDYYEYLTVKDLIKEWQPDIIVSAAAISDYIGDKTFGKISSEGDELIIRLRKGEKVIKSFRELAPDAFIVGFKLLVSPSEEEIRKAVDKVFDSEVDMVVYNDLTELRKGNATRRVYVAGYQDPEDPEYYEAETARDLTEQIETIGKLRGLLNDALYKYSKTS